MAADIDRQTSFSSLALFTLVVSSKLCGSGGWCDHGSAKDQADRWDGSTALPAQVA